jgi:peptide deformylase
MVNIFQIAQIGSPVLRNKTKKIKNLKSKENKYIIESMKKTLEEVSGLGLAAPQVYISQKIILVSSRPTPTFKNAPDLELTVMINPVILKYSSDKESAWESCLSIPGYVGLVNRSKNIYIKYTDANGKIKKEKYSNLPARVIQHEYDHLNGILYIDRINTKSDFVTSFEYQKILSRNSKI